MKVHAAGKWTPERGQRCRYCGLLLADANLYEFGTSVLERNGELITDFKYRAVMSWCSHKINRKTLWDHLTDAHL
jgi:hypothetical protein